MQKVLPQLPGDSQSVDKSVAAMVPVATTPPTTPKQFWGTTVSCLHAYIGPDVWPQDVDGQGATLGLPVLSLTKGQCTMPFLKSLCQYLEYFICAKAFESAVVDDALNVELGGASDQKMQISAGKVTPDLKLLFGGKVSLVRSPGS